MIKKANAFTIVELLIVIVVIAILAAISIVAYTGIQDRAIASKRESDMAMLLRGIIAARVNQDKVIADITGSTWSIGACTNTNNPSGTEPKDLPKSHACWTRYYALLTNIGNAAGMDLSPLRDGDTRGNPYMFDENEGESGNVCAADGNIRYFIGSGILNSAGPAIPKYLPAC